MSYHIEPGSIEDLAVTRFVDYVEHSDWTAHYPDDLTHLDVNNTSHMLALGLRLQLRRLGVTDPATLVAPLHAAWYGGEAPGAQRYGGDVGGER